MAITPVPPLDRTSATFRSDVDVFFGSRISNFVSEVNALAANLNSIAAGGAYAIPFTLVTNYAFVGGQNGRLSIKPNAGAMADATEIVFDSVDVRGTLLKSQFDDLFYNGTTSAIRGYIRLVKLGDPSKWMTFRVAGWSYSGGAFPFGSLAVLCVGYSSANAFADGDSILMHCQRTGDKGDSGALTPVLWVRDEKASGTNGGASTAGATTQRVLNAVKKNTISGASLSGNQIALPAGTYRMNMAVPCYSVGGTQAWLYNVTDGAVQIAGSSEYNVKSTVMGAEFTISAAKVFEVRHYATASNATGLGFASSSGQAEVYTELFIEKVS